MGIGSSKSGAKIDFLFEMANLVGKYMFFSAIIDYFVENKGKKKLTMILCTNLKLLTESVSFPCNENSSAIGTPLLVYNLVLYHYYNSGFNSESLILPS